MIGLFTVPLGTPIVRRTLFLEAATLDVVLVAYPDAIVHGIVVDAALWFEWSYRAFPAYSATDAEKAELATHNIEEAVRTRRVPPAADPIQVINERQQAFETLLPLDILTAEVRDLQGAGGPNPIVRLGYRGPTGYLVRVELSTGDETYTWIRLTEDGTGRQGSGNLADGFVTGDCIAHLRGYLSPP